MCKIVLIGWSNSYYHEKGAIMKRNGLFYLAALVACVLAASAHAVQPEPASRQPDVSRWVRSGDLRIPDSFGVNIHFTDPRPGEMEMLAAAGFKWVRMDFGWAGTERRKGEYDFSAFDRLMKALQPHGIRALFILDYRNKLYDDNLSPHTPEGRAAFARWAVAAARHFQGQGVIWEMYNEPNIKNFWKPKPNVDDYVALALEVGKALRQAVPGEQYIGPATSEIDLKFLEACFKAGLLEYWSAVSVHPYRNKLPETVTEEYARLRALIDQYAPKGKQIPIISGEWGFTVEKQRTPEIQGEFLARQFLLNLMNGVPLSIWYDWHDDGPDPKEREHHFGTVLYPYYKNRVPVYDPKPAYHAAKTLLNTLAGCVYDKRLDAGSPDAFVLSFKRNGAQCLAAWTSSDAPRTVTIPGVSGKFRAVGHTGQSQSSPESNAAGLKLTLTDAPVYLVPDKEKP